MQGDFVGVAKHADRGQHAGALAVTGIFDVRRRAAVTFAAGVAVSTGTPTATP